MASDFEALMDEYITNLRRPYSVKDVERYKLADFLESCGSKSRCNTAACPRCSAEHQHHSIKQLKVLWRKATKLATKTLIIPKLHRPIGELNTIKLESIKRHFRRKFEAADLTHIPVWGYIDLSLNIHSDGEYDPHWSPHLHFVTLTEYAPELAKLNDVMVYDDSVKRPSRRDTVNDLDWQLSYISKFRPIRRVDFDKTSPKARPSKFWLKPAQNVEFLLWIGQYTPADRGFMINMRLYGDELCVIKQPDELNLSSIKSAD